MDESFIPLDGGLISTDWALMLEGFMVLS